MIYRFQRTLSYRLLAWSVLSIVWALGCSMTPGADRFQQGLSLQFIVWALVDTVIALLGLCGLEAKIQRVPDLYQSSQDHRKLHRLLWINAGLDVLYIAGGAALILTLGQTDAFARGNGLGILIQGGFLLIFDLLHALSIPREQKLPRMAQFDQPAHQPFDIPGERGTVVLVHGFPGTPVEMRDLGEALNRQGWRAVGILLPGYGREIENLFHQRASGWIHAIEKAIQDARAQTKGPVILAGFSMGGGLSLSAAARTQPDGIVLISPFWFDLNPIILAFIRIFSIFLPEYFNPFRLIPVNRVENSGHFHPPPGNLYPPAPEFFRGMGSGLHLPLLFLEQFIELSRLLKRNASRITAPTLVVQGNSDPIVRPALTRRLIAMLSISPKYIEVKGEHHITIKGASGYLHLEQELLAFTAKFG